VHFSTSSIEPKREEEQEQQEYSFSSSLSFGSGSPSDSFDSHTHFTHSFILRDIENIDDDDSSTHSDDYSYDLDEQPVQMTSTNMDPFSPLFYTNTTTPYPEEDDYVLRIPDKRTVASRKSARYLGLWDEKTDSADPNSLDQSSNRRNRGRKGTNKYISSSSANDWSNETLLSSSSSSSSSFRRSKRNHRRQSRGSSPPGVDEREV
jgi:hypothetical protein